MRIEATNLVDNFIKYVKIDTTADETSGLRPSSSGQSNLCALLRTQFEEMDLYDIVIGPNGTLYSKLPSSTGCENLPTLGFIAHMDTSGSFSGKVNPLFHENYDGGVIKFSNGDCIDPQKFDSLKSFIGQTLITGDGSSLLGADDKAGVAEIMELIHRIKEKDIPHPPMSFAFTTDEEIGLGAEGFDLNQFGANFAYTVDGGTIGGIEYETFNAATAILDVSGVSVHTGEAKNLLVNAATIAAEFVSMLPKEERPELTEGYEGFIHVDSFNGSVASASVVMLIRDHDSDKFMDKKNILTAIVNDINGRYNDVASIKIEDSYQNMGEVIKNNYHLVENAVKAINITGVKSYTNPIRGGTDGARLSFMGLPCPNLATGGAAFHGPYEHISVEAMDKSVDILCELTKLYSVDQNQ